MDNSIKLSDNDNVIIALKDFEQGEVLLTDNMEIKLFDQIGKGAEVALRDIRKGEKIIEYNIPIGSAVRPIKRGEHIHGHNVKREFLIATKI